MASSKESTDFSITTGTMIRAVLVLIGFFLIWYLRDLVLVLLTSIVIASFVEEAVPFFQKRKISRVLGVAIMYILGGIFFAGLFYFFAPLLITEVYKLSGLLASYFPDSAFLHYFQNEVFSGAKDVVANISGEGFSFANLIETSQAFISNLSAGFFQTLSVAFGSIFNVILIVIISFYLSVQDKGIENFLRIIIPLEYEDYAVDLWNRSRRKIARWMKGQLLIALLVAILIYLSLLVVGIEYALLLAIIAGIMEFIPYGVLIALIPAVSFSYIAGGIPSALIVTGIYIIIHQFEVFLFQPLIINKVVGLSPLVVILAALVGFELGGFWGLVLAVPVAVFVMELMSDLEKHKIFTRESYEQK
jgi:predicted PurR-regulated permease PerM